MPMAIGYKAAPTEFTECISQRLWAYLSMAIGYRVVPREANDCLL